MPTIRIVQATAADAYAVSLQIPEFDPWYPWTKWQGRLEGRTVLSLLALVDDVPAGFKIGYHEREHFYSWIGGVLPKYRRMGLATLLADEQELLVRASGTLMIRMKTRNRFRTMILFALGRDFYLSGVEQRDDPEDTGITLHKNL